MSVGRRGPPSASPSHHVPRHASISAFTLDPARPPSTYGFEPPSANRAGSTLGSTLGTEPSSMTRQGSTLVAPEPCSVSLCTRPGSTQDKRWVGEMAPVFGVVWPRV